MNNMLKNIQPSHPGYDFATADLARAGISKADLNRFLARNAQPGTGGTGIDTLTLLAQILRSMKKANTNMQVRAWAFGTYIQQMILTENPNRDYLFIQNAGLGDVLVVFQSANTNAEAIAVADATTLQTRAIRIVGGGYYEPLIAPTNAVSIFTINTATNGIVVEGQ